MVGTEETYFLYFVTFQFGHVATLRQFIKRIRFSIVIFFVLNACLLPFSDCAVTLPSKQCQDDAVANELWKLTIQALKLHDDSSLFTGKGLLHI